VRKGGDGAMQVVRESIPPLSDAHKGIVEANK
jgi:hypothetical protein